MNAKRNEEPKGKTAKELNNPESDRELSEGARAQLGDWQARFDERYKDLLDRLAKLEIQEQSLTSRYQQLIAVEKELLDQRELFSKGVARLDGMITNATTIIESLTNIQESLTKHPTKIDLLVTQGLAVIQSLKNVQAATPPTLLLKNANTFFESLAEQLNLIEILNAQWLARQERDPAKAVIPAKNATDHATAIEQYLRSFTNQCSQDATFMNMDGHGFMRAYCDLPKGHEGPHELQLMPTHLRSLFSTLADHFLDSFGGEQNVESILRTYESPDSMQEEPSSGAETVDDLGSMGVMYGGNPFTSKGLNEMDTGSALVSQTGPSSENSKKE